MKYLLDTNICIYIINKRPTAVLERFTEHEIGDVGMSVITLYELLYGAYKSQNVTKNVSAVRKFSTPLEIIEFESQTADACGQLRAQLERRGQVIGPMDMQIAATALTHGYTLVTHNVKEFSRVGGLDIENWAH